MSTTKTENKFTASIEIPPSVNNLYFNKAYRDKNTGRLRTRRVMTNDGRTYKEVTGWHIKDAANLASWVYLGGRIEMVLDLTFKDKRRRDITNCIKAVEDAASETLGFDDTIVDSFLVRRVGVDKEWPGAEITIIEIL